MPEGTVDCDAVIIGTGPAGATAADVLTGAGWSVIMLEKGRNHLLALDEPFGPLGHVSNDEIKFFRRYFLGPDPFLEPRTYRRDNDDGDHLFGRRRKDNNVRRFFIDNKSVTFVDEQFVRIKQQRFIANDRSKSVDQTLRASRGSGRFGKRSRHECSVFSKKSGRGPPTLI